MQWNVVFTEQISSVQIHTNFMKEHKHATLTNQMFRFCFGAINKKIWFQFFNGFLRICSSQHSFVSLSEKQLVGESSLLIILKLHWRKIFDFTLSFSSIAHAHDAFNSPMKTNSFFSSLETQHGISLVLQLLAVLPFSNLFGHLWWRTKQGWIFHIQLWNIQNIQMAGL